MTPHTPAMEGGLAMDSRPFAAALPDPATAFLDLPPVLAVLQDLDIDLNLDFEFDPNFSLDDLLEFRDVEGDPFLTESDDPQQADASDCGHSAVSPQQTNGSSESGSDVSPQKATGPCECETGVSPPQATGSNGFGSGVSASSPVNIVTEDFDSGNSPTHYAGRGCYATGSPDSGNSAARTSDAKVVKGSGLKRKSERDDDQFDGNPNSVSKLPRRPHLPGVATTSQPSIAGADEDEKRKARLIRNRESAQLSRQRKKLYVDELEEKVKVMNSTIADLNNRISYFMAENASLRQRLSSSSAGNSASLPVAAVYPPVHLMTSMQYPWMPWSGYTMMPGSQTPLVPIPKMRTQDTVSTAKLRGTKKRGDSKTKKVAGVSLVGLLFFMIILGAFVPSINFRSGHLASSGHNYSKKGGLIQHRERVLPITGNSEDSRFCRGNRDCDKTKGYPTYVKDTDTELEGHRETSLSGNATEPLLASLYVPRNNKLVKIDGNLIISSVLATERAVTQTKSVADAYRTGHLSGNGDKETNLAISSAIAIVDSGKEVESLSLRHRGPADEHHKTQEWFHEGLEGPIFRSGMCTEVFQFDASLASRNGGGMVPATNIFNTANNETVKPSLPINTTNRRILFPHSVQPARYALNNVSSANKGFSEPSGRSSSSNTTTGKPIVVSVLVDPREGVDRDVDSLLSPHSISRIFVVVLVDSVKYITYSCMLPRKSNIPHLVTV